MRVPLNETAIIRLSALGAGTAKLGPLTAREKWYPTVVSVSANPSPVAEAQCIISIGDANTKTLCDGTVNGSSGDASDRVTGKVISSGQYVWADWTGGDASVSARMTVTGEKEI